MAKPDWITVNPSSGTGSGTFNITFAPNTSTSARSGIVTAKSISGLIQEIQVTQAGKVASKGKITFEYTGEEIPQKYVGYNFFVGDGEAGSLEFYANYGQIESINADTIVVNLDSIDESNLKTILVTIKVDMLEMDNMYFGVSPSDDPTAEWVPLLLTTNPEDKDYTSDLVAAKIQSAFNGANEIISPCESLIVPSGSDIVCSWDMSAANLMYAATTVNALKEASVSSVTFKVFADLYPDGNRLTVGPLNNIEVGQFTLGIQTGQSLNKTVTVSKTSQKFTWYKEWSTVALCRFTIEGDFNEIVATISKSLIINGKTFTKHENAGQIYFENLEGIPLIKTSDSQQVIVSSNTPTLSFNTFA